ncbi:hypothetical protein [Shewanella sp.]|uniref:hypothetical protein n=1 Tax=Shewanella sp. TaxID=50422 RepID=UPI001EC8376C|nr:hypothetical protein [Shewanella sp.]NRB25767.1 hypothetical protein [Shewanella sp.]
MAQIQRVHFRLLMLVAAWLSLYNEFNPDDKFNRQVTRLIRIIYKELDVTSGLIATVWLEVENTESATTG